MSTPRIWVRHIRYKNRIRISAYAHPDRFAIYVQDIPPLKSRELGKFKMTLRRALQLRYEK